MRVIYLIIILMMYLPGQTQSILSNTMNTSGGSGTAGGIVLEWSVGEMATFTLAGTGGYLTQGVLQPAGMGQGPLPVHWLYFKATANGSANLLEWKVAQELNNDRFEIERSVNGLSFSFFKLVKSLGNTTNPRTYITGDATPFSNISYYRVRQVDVNGAFTYSNIAIVQRNTSASVEVYPNPATDHVNVTLTPSAYSSALKMFDASGRLVHSMIIPAHTNVCKISLSRFPAGMYTVYVQQNGRLVSAQLLKK